MTHDPLCHFSVTQADRGNRCGWCDVIARVREDERGRAAARLSQHWQETVGRGEPTVAEDELAAVLGTESPTVLHRRVGGCIPHYDDGYAAALRDAKRAVWEALGPMDCTDPTQMDTALAAIEGLGEER